MKNVFQLTALFLLLSPLFGCHQIANFVFCKHFTDSAATSPSGHYIADVISEDCGATEHATLVTIRRKGWISKKENLFIVENTHNVKLFWSNVRCCALIRIGFRKQFYVLFGFGRP